MEQAKILEMVLRKFREGISAEEAKPLTTKPNNFVSKQPGFVARKTALAGDGKIIDF